MQTSQGELLLESSGLRVCGRRVSARGAALLGVALAALCGSLWLAAGHGALPAGPPAAGTSKPDVTAPGKDGVCSDRETCLSIVDAFLERQPRQSFMGGKGVGLMQTFGPDSFDGGPCGDKMCKLVEPCPNYEQTPHCRFDVYDNALAAIYLTRRGRLEEARSVLKSFLYFLYDDKGARDSSPCGLKLLAASYTDAPAKAGDYQGVGVADGAVDTGNNAWVGLAFTHFAAETGEACYARVARDILEALRHDVSCADDEMGGFAARGPPYPHNYRSTEHNIDVFSLSRALNSSADAESAATFVRSMAAGLAAVEIQLGQNRVDAQSGGQRLGTLFANAVSIEREAPDTYVTGTGDAAHCDATIPLAAAAADVQFWSLLADADPSAARKNASVTFALRNPGSAQRQAGLWQIDEDLIGSPGGEGKGQELYGFRFTSWGNGIQARPETHVAASTWAGLLLLYQHDDGAPVDDAANPFAPPRKPAHPGCSALTGECCPTAIGMMLECCGI
ncbi:hypothetical protein EMIHUDRAFT_449267 [Emiliania huxleyi CCMP1516]|uniref:Alginate lyase domain-containing protein n=2 Tax=Emiliania huxleyi TaxID=2903 RepID=A0A0D3KIH5_EMIH1|nr:hypothetical protein EMIHUDRAFT_449267 [Emiliania huxleyi CCMP1516]EOD35560.1 hypothetical protein EMIHUDRAFT_449267 [Emiliania huxleyi CCMP1516]|eukprot:XP_005787989.1 hypothetical protein EMIHUDRAFT_449267 [Emiliania huxleyi CCMP1516]